MLKVCSAYEESFVMLLDRHTYIHIVLLIDWLYTLHTQEDQRKGGGGEEEAIFVLLLESGVATTGVVLFYAFLVMWFHIFSFLFSLLFLFFFLVDSHFI